MNNILVTAIGSMSAECVISSLNEEGYNVIGCDIYPKEWHNIAKECTSFYQVSIAQNETAYIQEIKEICKKESINFIFPLTDVEVDVLSIHRECFERNNIIVCMPNNDSLNIARDKYKLFIFFRDDKNVPSINTVVCRDRNTTELSLPLILKPKNGRSSIGLSYINTSEQLLQIKKQDNYIFQEQIVGPIFTVDLVRNPETNSVVSIPREELVRTSNGAGFTVKISTNTRIAELAEYIAAKLNIRGCVNMEFIYHNSDFYLIDINPRFSAGVAFSKLCGYNMTINHLKCFQRKEIDTVCDVQESIMTKLYKEVVLDDI